MKMLFQIRCDCGDLLNPLMVDIDVETTGVEVTCPRCLRSAGLVLESRDSTIPDTLESLDRGD